MSAEIIFAIIAVAGLAYYATYRSRHRDLVHLRRGLSLAEHGEYAEALVALKSALEANPELIEARLAMVHAYHRLDRLDEAIDLCREVVAALGDDKSAVDVWQQLGWLCVEAGRAGEAVTAFERVIEIWPENIEVRMALAEAKQSLGRHEEALEAFQELVSLRGPDLALWYRMGDVYRALGKQDEAVDAYKKALQMQLATSRKGVEPAQTLMVLGDTYAHFGRFEEALAAYTDAHEPDAAWPAPYCGMGDVLAKLGRADEAMASFRKALEADDTWEDAYRGIGDLHAAAGRTDDALAAYRKAIDINPHFAAAHLDMGKLLAATGDEAGAKESLESAIELDPRGEIGNEARAALDDLATPRMGPD
ncbi:MAG: tetratricopeptide repeat protein [Phycisphaerae bacterium]|nr:tetratricopeptide repeat protein [Phycisphaerae bacterium]